jgi:hypothetical protein
MTRPPVQRPRRVFGIDTERHRQEQRHRGLSGPGCRGSGSSPAATPVRCKDRVSWRVPVGGECRRAIWPIRAGRDPGSSGQARRWPGFDPGTPRPRNRLPRRQARTPPAPGGRALSLRSAPAEQQARKLRDAAPGRRRRPPFRPTSTRRQWDPASRMAWTNRLRLRSRPVWGPRPWRSDASVARENRADRMRPHQYRSLPGIVCNEGDDANDAFETTPGR